MGGDAERVKAVIEMLLKKGLDLRLIVFFQAFLQLDEIMMRLLLHLSKFDFKFGGTILERGLGLG